ncbi:hypothetical protein [Colidextribacter sp. OB.20]|uniref:hypothetical protein n=1 Tax=Colidextribacter sp. OB.20 TaxID=2304568 RepID=UPI00191BE926|nr:hypothetical protein [Colidextribacter sp. OB.20]
MSDKELVTMTIEHYGDLQRIKQANGDYENPALDYVLKLTIAKLSSLGVNVEDITLN